MSTDAEENKNYLRVRNEVEDLKELVRELVHKVEVLTDKVDTNTVNTSDMIDAWKTAKGLSTFVKWLSTLVISAGVVWAAVHSNFKG